MAEVPDRSPIRVVIVDDHPAIIEALYVFLEPAPEIVVVGAATDGESALRLVASVRPDVLILDLGLDGLSGLEVARQVRSEQPAVAILVLTGLDAPGNRQALERLGVRGYLDKRASGPEIRAAVRTLAAGGIVDPARMRHMTPPGMEPLSEREHEVLRLLAAGRRNADIAEAIDLSVKSVEMYVSRLLTKFGARSRTELAGQALAAGLVLHAAPARDDATRLESRAGSRRAD